MARTIDDVTECLNWERESRLERKWAKDEREPPTRVRVPCADDYLERAVLSAGLTTASLEDEDDLDHPDYDTREERAMDGAL